MCLQEFLSTNCSSACNCSDSIFLWIAILPFVEVTTAQEQLKEEYWIRVYVVFFFALFQPFVVLVLRKSKEKKINWFGVSHSSVPIISILLCRFFFHRFIFSKSPNSFKYVCTVGHSMILVYLGASTSHTAAHDCSPSFSASHFIYASSQTYTHALHLAFWMYKGISRYFVSVRTMWWAAQKKEQMIFVFFFFFYFFLLNADETTIQKRCALLPERKFIRMNALRCITSVRCVRFLS